MRKRVLLISWVAVLLVIACACGSKGPDIALSKTISAAENTITFLVPENWEGDHSLDYDALVLTMTDNVSAYAHVYYYGYDEDYAALNDFLSEYVDLYDDDVVGDVLHLEIDGRSAVRFEYLYDDFNENFEEARFHGYVYLIEAPLGVINVDIYNTAVDPADKQDVSTPQQRALLEQIAESLTISPKPGETGGTETEP